MKKILWLIITIMINYSTVFSQCGEDTYMEVMAKAGKNVVLVRDFKVHMRPGNKRNPSPTIKYSVLMQKGLSYRFNIEGDKHSITQPVMQLSDRNNELGSTFDYTKGTNVGTFTYSCPRTGNYQVLISMRDGKAGCAVGLMSMLIDSAFYAQGYTKPEQDDYVLYLGVENPLNIVTDAQKPYKLDISINNGQIISHNNEYFAVVTQGDSAEIHAKVINQGDTVVEEIKQDFVIKPLPPPTVSLEKAKGEYIGYTDIVGLLKLVVKPSVYKIQEFYVSQSLTPYSGLISNSIYLTPEQMDLIKMLNSNDRFYINDIRVLTPDGKVELLGPLVYWIR